ncbi:DUF2807 domain-containing protein [Sphingomonas sabuli]|uniref:DUF2807 domain-containing protein n=1 Tax=Sphingomonas sabuli TaxID=2764186 RepID=A0A7G9L0U1_9SPHN|nr:DUF2807 domain-containing protein [Sphingomonas sabuli]QNM82240.1 DUF2807 domain-containing protein [Sphingomonas sabuli]
MTARLCLAALIAATVPTAALAADRNYTVTGFDRIRVDGPYRVQLVTGVAPFARASGTAAAIDGIDVQVQGRTLIVRKSQSNWGNYPDDNPGPVLLKVGTHELTALYVNGAGSLSVDKVRGMGFELSLIGSGAVEIAGLDVDRLNASVKGSGSARLAGKAARAMTNISGTGLVDAAALAVKDATASAEGAAVLRLNASNTAKINALGTATVEMTGRADCTVKTSGSSLVSGCR